MLFLGRSLSNSVVNLGIRDEYANALKELGFEFEVLAEQVNEDTLLLLLFLVSYMVCDTNPFSFPFSFWNTTVSFFVKFI